MPALTPCVALRTKFSHTDWKGVPQVTASSTPLANSTTARPPAITGIQRRRSRPHCQMTAGTSAGAY